MKKEDKDNTIESKKESAKNSSAKKTVEKKVTEKKSAVKKVDEKKSEEKKVTEKKAVSEKSKEIKPVEKRVRKTRVRVPDVKWKKLPKLFRKKYTEKRFQRKILKKLYIPEDKKFVNSFFKQEESDNPKKPGKFAIPQNQLFDKKDVKRLSSLAKQIKKQKGRIRLLPLIASVTFIVVAVVLFVSTKNILLTRVIRNAFETQFEARCDIGKLDLRLLDSSFTVKRFELANKNEPMKNIFSFDSLIVDFDLTQLLKAKFVAEELSINGMAVNSDRSYDGSLPKAKLNKIRAKKEKKARENAEKKEKMKQSLTTATNKVKDNVTNTIVDTFNTFNPKNIVENCYSQMTTPEMAKKIQDETNVLITKWKDTPDKVMKQVQNVQKSAEDVIYFDYNSIKDDPTKIKDMLETIDNSLKTLDDVKTETENTLNEIQSDFSDVETLTYEVRDSIEHDVDVTTNEINKLKSYRLPTGQEFISSTIDIYGYELLGKYYPYLKQGIEQLLILKDKQVPIRKPVKKEEKPKKEEVRRAEGRTINFVKDRNPKFWIKKISVSGFNMSLDITDIANDMNKTNKPAEAIFKFNYKDMVHGGKVVVDIRTKTENPLVYVEYTCDGSSFSHADNIPGVPQIKTDANYMCNAKVVQDNSFVLSGNADFYNMNLTTPSFEPVYIYDIYSSVLNRFDSAKVGLEVTFGGPKGFDLQASSDLDKQIASALNDEINERLRVIKEAIEKEISGLINKYADDAKVVVDKFNEIQNKILESENKLRDLENQIIEKQNEFTNKLEAAQKQAEEKIQQETERVQNEIENKLEAEAAKREEEREKAVEEMKKKNEERKQEAEKKAEDALKGMFGGLKRP